jgi:hypothetical protein
LLAEFDNILFLEGITLSEDMEIHDEALILQPTRSVSAA